MASTVATAVQRRPRDSIPGMQTIHADVLATGSVVEPETAWERRVAAMHLDMERLQLEWSHFLDDTFAMLTNGNKTTRPRGRLTEEQIMELWSKATKPAMEVAKVRRWLTRARGEHGGVTKTEADQVRRHMTAARDAESRLSAAVAAALELEDELRIDTGIVEPLGLLLGALPGEEKHGATAEFEKAACCAEVALRGLSTLGVYVSDSCVSPTTTMPILAHFAHLDGSGPTTTPNFQPVTPEASELSLVALSRSELVRMDAHAHGDALRLLCAEAGRSMQSTDDSDTNAIARGVFFTDTDLGLACIATSALVELGGTINDSGTAVTIADECVGEFFDVAFLGAARIAQVADGEEAVDCVSDHEDDL